MQNRRFVSFALVLATACAVAVGCRNVATQKGLLERQADDAKLTSRQLRVLVNEFAIHFVDRVEVTADQIMAKTPDPQVRRNALLWKINATSTCFQAASRPDPLAAYLDVWTLNRQMTQYFESPAGSTLFGPGQSLALAECHALERRLQDIDRAVGGKLRFGEKTVAKFAADFPVHSLYFDREPIASRYIEEVREPPSELMHVVGNLDESITELRKLGTVYTKHLPKQARWEAELFLLNSVQLDAVQRPLHDLALSAVAISRIAQVSDSLPALVERERLALRAIVAEEREQVFADLERMREATVADLRSERSVVLAAVQEQRVAMTRDLHAELSVAIDAADGMTQRRTAEVIEQAPGLIDHFVWRACQGFVFLAVLAAPIGWFALRLRRQDSEHGGTIASPEFAEPPSSSFGAGELKIAA